jgi:hypothetical protein
MRFRRAKRIVLIATMNDAPTSTAFCRVSSSSLKQSVLFRHYEKELLLKETKSAAMLA